MVCARCGTRFRAIEVVHFVELLPGARESVPSVLYVIAVVTSFVLGGVAVAIVGLVDEELLQNDTWLIGTFLLGAGGALFALFALIGAWARRRSRR